MTLLGAGASADAGYPMGGAFLPALREQSRKDEWESELRSFSDAHLDELERLLRDVGQLTLPPRLTEPVEGQLFSGGSLVYRTERGVSFATTLIERRTSGSEARLSPVYLEDFFAFWDSVYQPPFSEIWSDRLRKLHHTDLQTRRHLLREMRDRAVWVVYDLLDPSRCQDAGYLIPLLRLPGPKPGTPVVCTLNFDLTVERAAREGDILVSDGFRPATDLSPPSSWHGSFLQAWNDLTETFEFYVGFQPLSDIHTELLKIHGSLGWFRIEEGSADVGWSEILRDNVRVSTFRHSPDEMLSGKPIQNFSGKNGFVCKSGRQLTGKMGQVWFRPDMVFARSRKLTPTGPMPASLRRFSERLAAARHLVAVGYGWRDSHINDVIFEQVARGLEVVNVSNMPVPNGLVELLVNKFPTTHRKVLHQFLCLGGGAKKAILSGAAITPLGGESAFSIHALSSDPSLLQPFGLGRWVEQRSEVHRAG